MSNIGRNTEEAGKGVETVGIIMPRPGREWGRGTHTHAVTDAAGMAAGRRLKPVESSEHTRAAPDDQGEVIQRTFGL